MDKQNKDTHLVVRIDSQFKKDYKEYCEDNGYTMSKRVLAIMKRDMGSNGKEENN